MAYPNATIYEFNETGIKQVLYEETDHYQITRSFLENPALSLQLLMENEEE
jgi:predicted ATPase